MNLTYLEIDHHRSAFDALSGRARDLFMERLLWGWIYHDHALEGVVLTQNDIERALSGQPSRNYCDGQLHKSLVRLRAAALALFEPETRRQDLSIDFIRDLHVRLCDPDDPKAGRYRQRDTSPGVYNLDVVAQGSISYYFHRFMALYEEELVRCHPVRAAAIAHWEFMRVFPFDERTGYVGRLMMNHILVRHGYPPAIIHANDRHDYFAALDGHRSDLVPVLVEAISATIGAARTFSQRFVESPEHGLAL